MESAPNEDTDHELMFKRALINFKLTVAAVNEQLRDNKKVVEKPNAIEEKVKNGKVRRNRV